MQRDLFVYISGPMTAKHGFTVEENVAAGLRVFLEALQRGIPAFCPHRFSGEGKAYEGLTKLTKAGPQWTAVGPVRSWDDHQLAAVLVTWLCCRRTVYATNPAVGCLACR